MNYFYKLGQQQALIDFGLLKAAQKPPGAPKKPGPPGPIKAPPPALGKTPPLIGKGEVGKRKGEGVFA